MKLKLSQVNWVFGKNIIYLVAATVTFGIQKERAVLSERNSNCTSDTAMQVGH